MRARTKRLLATAVAVGAVASGISLTSQPADAYPPYDPDTHETSVTLPTLPDDEDTDTPIYTDSYNNGSTAAIGCGEYTWASPPKVVIHNREFLDGDVGELVSMHTAIDDVIDQFNEVGATSAAISAWESTDDPFAFGEWFSDATPTIHVGFAEDFDALTTSEHAAGVEDHQHWSDCSIREAHIAFPLRPHDDIAYSWNFMTPFTTYGEKYYDTQPWDSSDGTWFRPNFLHELLHAFDLGHSASTYSFMNYPSFAGFPWANRADEDSIRPLPADVRTLRELYPAAGSRTEVAVLNTWHDENAELDNGAAPQKLLCEPSLGDAWGDRLSAGTCGTEGPDDAQGSTEICAGDTLRTRFALANYSTEDVDIIATLWFSEDEQFESADFDSVSWHGFNVPAAHSQLKAFTFEVPDIVDVPGTQYHPIVYVVSTSDADNDGLPDADSVRAEWIPLRGTLEIC